uniref:hypothetical protein n=1 Tax=Candidatus Fervidibacter sp. TaxID=3100871 RepID=UPI004049B807
MKIRRGLTLVELVVVMVLLLFIGLSVGGLVRIVRDTEQSIARTTEMNQTGRVVLQRLIAELSSALPLPVILGETQIASAISPEFSGYEAMGTETTGATSVLTFYHEDAFDLKSGLDLDTIRFTTANADPRRSASPQFDTIEVAYYIDTDPQTPEQGLVRSVGTLPGLLPEELSIDQTQTEVLSELIVSLNFRFYDPDTGEWLDIWDVTDVLPALVEITIGVAPSRCDEFLAQLDKDPAAISFVEWLTTVIPIRVRSYPDPSVQQQQSQTSSPSGAQQTPPTQRPLATPSATNPQFQGQLSPPSSFQTPSSSRPFQQRPSVNVRSQRGGER